MSNSLSVKLLIISFSLGLMSLITMQAGAQSTAIKPAYRITVSIPNMPDSTIHLANYYGEKTYMTDTAKTNSRGIAVFEGSEPLPGGIYIVAAGKNRVFEFIVNQEQVMTFETSGPDYVANMHIKGSPENDLFFQYIRFNADKYKEAQPLQEQLKGKAADDEGVAEIREQLKKINEDVESHRLAIIANHPNTFLAAFFKAMKDPEIPPAPILENGREDSTFAYRYYRSHYWDNIDLSDERLLRSPILHGKYEQYFDKVLIQHPDTIIKEADRLIALTRPNQEMFKYLVWLLTIKYETSKVMGFDAVFVHLIDTYYATGQAFWINETVLNNIMERADILRPILLGKVAPNLIMLDTNERPVSMHAIKANYTLLYFWDTECGHCKKESPKLRDFYATARSTYGLEVFAVCADTSYAKMKKYIRDNELPWINVNGPRSLTGKYHDLYDIYSTPVMYLLDKDKKIVAKRLLTDQLASFLERYEADRRKEATEGS
ncbi:MAG TPA: DUF5106 domain-containing protein [Bacteroidales bacterium]|nr:redoxin domain-containing protein [Lentimicrobiaceae bacterium]HOH99242.1 DUF5106 domain-containing protein [Bacteroidales bacterium]